MRYDLADYITWIQAICDSMASRCPAGMEPADLMGYAVIGFYDAAGKYDPSRGNAFKTYAEIRIRGAIGDGIRKWCHIGRDRKTVPILSMEGEYSTDIAQAMEKASKEDSSEREELLDDLRQRVGIYDLLKRLPYPGRMVLTARIKHRWTKKELAEFFDLNRDHVARIERKSLVLLQHIMT